MRKGTKVLLTVTAIFMLSMIAGCNVQNQESKGNTSTQTDENGVENEQVSNVDLPFEIFTEGHDYSDLPYDMTRNFTYYLYLYEKNGWNYGTGWNNETGKALFQKVRDTGDERTIICPDCVTYKIQEYEGYIYAICNIGDQQYGLYKANDSGDNFHLIMNEATWFQIADNQIYYTWYDENKNQKLYKCDLDGANSELVLDGNTYYDYIFDDKVIYQDDPDGEHIKIKKLDSDDIITITNKNSYCPILDGKNMYYVAQEKSTKDGEYFENLCKVDLSSMQETILKANVPDVIQYVDGYIYFQNPEDNNRVYKIGTDGKNLQMVCQDTNISDLQVKTSGILFANMTEDGSQLAHYYWANLDGTSKVDLVDENSWWRK